MAEGADCASGIAAKRRQPSAARKSRLSQHKKSPSSRVRLEKVLGITTASGSGLTSDPNTGLVAYPAGCVVVLLHPKKNKQTHIINTCRRPFSALAFSHDGKYLVTGESGHKPCVCVWEVGGAKVAEVQSHNYGVSHVAFSTNSQYIVSVGFQHDKTVSVWDWRKGSIIASNKVSSRVLGVSFSQDSSYFVTAGNRHVKFWFLEASKEQRVNSAVPLIGRSGLLGDQRNSVFCGVACGRGLAALSTFCITRSGLLCLFNSSRQLEAWVNLKTSSASCLAASEDFVFCGCAEGVVRVFRPCGLQYVATLPRPHRLGVALSCGRSSPPPGAQYPHTLALSADPASTQLACVYTDHSVYVWDVRDLGGVRKLYSALYHGSSVWSLEVYPDRSPSCLPASSFFTCSSDGTVRLWDAGPPAGHRNLLSHDLLKILYVGEKTQHLQAEGEAAGADGKAGIRVLEISPDGQHLAAGDRCGNLHIFSLDFLEEQLKIEAHDSEVLCLAFSPRSTGVKLLASGGRDRLIHIFNVEKNFSLEQTLNDHSGSVTAVSFTGQGPDVRMVSCGADKSIYFQTAEQTPAGLLFSRSHHVVEKATLYDMDLDASRTHVAVACQDRNIRVYNVQTGKMKKCVKGSSGDEGAVIKVQMDPSGSFFATSCSEKSISVFDYESGERLCSLVGHSEIVTCMRFSQDCRHLMTASGDSCVFVWRLDSQMTSTMRKRRSLKAAAPPEGCGLRHQIRRETFITAPSFPPQEEEEEEEEGGVGTPARLDVLEEPPLLQTNGKMPMWFRRLQSQGNAPAVVQSEAEPRQVRGRWAEQTDAVVICSGGGVTEDDEEEEEEEDEDFHPQSLEELLGEEEGDEEEGEKQAGPAGEGRSYLLYASTNAYSARDFSVEGVADPQQSVAQPESKGQGAEPAWSRQLSPDSALSDGSTGSLEQQPDADTDSLSQGSSGSLCLEEDEDRNSLKNHFDALASGLSEEKFDTDLRSLQPPEEKHFLNPRLSISARFLSRFQDRVRAWPTRAAPPVTVPTRISEDTSNTSVNSDLSSDVTPQENTQVKCRRSVLHRRASYTNSHQPLHHPRRRRHTVVVVQCKETPRDVSSRSHDGGVAAAGQDAGPKVGFLGPTATSGPKLCQSGEEKLPSEGGGFLGSGVAPPQEQSRIVSSQNVQSESVGGQATPTGVMSLGSSGKEAVRTNQKHDAVQSPAPPTAPTDPPICDIFTCSASSEVGGAKTGIRTDPGAGASDAPLTLLQCQQLAEELKRVARRAVGLHRQLSVSPDASDSQQQQQQMAAVLQAAFQAVSCDLQGALQRGRGQPEEDSLMVLLEKYSEQLVQMTQRKLSRR